MIFQLILRAFATKRTNLSELREHLQRLHAMPQIYLDGRYTKNDFAHGDYKNRAKLKNSGSVYAH